MDKKKILDALQISQYELGNRNDYYGDGSASSRIVELIFNEITKKG